ncbi:MAG: hypothetical protein H0T40_06240 [Geodermatophilaceae bacterium]|nr:hypothetical protein [Geodermatophilaceae bacterium]
MWAPIRLLPLPIGAAYLAVLHGLSSTPGWEFGMVSAALAMGGGRWPLAVTVAQSMLLAFGLLIVDLPVAGPLVLVLAAAALGELATRRGGW